MQLLGQQKPRTQFLLFPEADLYLRADSERAHFAVLIHQLEKAGQAERARKEITILRNTIEYAEKKHPGDVDRISSLKAELAAQRKLSHDKKQICYPVRDMPQVISALPRDRDTWISQNLFHSRAGGWMTRQRVNFLSSSVLFVDLDFYKAGVFSTHDECLQHALEMIKGRGWPLPTLAIFSGRGLYLKWCFETALPRSALTRWEAAERHLVDFLAQDKSLGVDEGVKDASRVLRAEGTLHEKSQQWVRVDWVNSDSAGQPVLYNYEFLFEHFLPWSRDSIKDARQRDAVSEKESAEVRREWQARQTAWSKTTEPQRQFTQKKEALGAWPSLLKFNGMALAWDRLCDLEALAQVRGWDVQSGGAGVAHGHRSHFILYYLSFLCLSGKLTESDFWREMLATCARFAPDLLKTHDKSVFSTLFSKFSDYLAGKKVEFGGRLRVPLYTPKNSTLIELFNITSDEERLLKTIVSQGEARRRDAARHRQSRQENGGLSRAEYLNTHEQKRVSARLMRAQGKSWGEVASALGYKSADSARIACRD